MRYSSLLSPLAAVTVLSASATLRLASASASTPAHSPAPHPQFKTVFAGDFDLASGYNITGPFGARVHNAMSGGSLWDPTTGEVLGEILPFSHDGLSSLRQLKKSRGNRSAGRKPQSSHRRLSVAL